MQNHANVTETRLANGRKLIAKSNGATSVARLMGYKNASFLTQIFGPNPTRAPTDKFMRKMESALGLESGLLDRPDAFEPRPPTAITTALDTGLLTQVIQLVGRIADEEAVKLSADRVAVLTAMGYEDAAENSGQAREGKLRQVIQLLK